MSDKSQEQALALLKEARAQGKLDPSVEKGLSELIGTEARPRLKEILGADEIIKPVGFEIGKVKAIRFNRTAGGYNVYLQADVPAGFNLVLLDKAGNEITRRKINRSSQEELISDEQMAQCHSILLSK